MKLFQFYRDGGVHTGMVLNGVHIDLERTAAGSGLPVTLSGILACDQAPAALCAAYAALTPAVLDEAAIDFAPAADHPEKILCVGLNYAAHQEETDLRNNAAFPPLFCKFANSLVGHAHPIHLPAAARRFDYEVELVVMLGMRASRVTPDEAAGCIFGYTVGNDFSARDLQMATSQWLMGKACDDFAPLGPYLVTADELNADDLRLTTRVNGELRQDGRTSDMIFNCCQIISHISQVMTLMPGDIIYTGTPSGVILGKPETDRVWLKTGDVVEVSIEGIGSLKNALV